MLTCRHHQLPPEPAAAVNSSYQLNVVKRGRDEESNPGWRNDRYVVMDISIIIHKVFSDIAV